MKLSFPQRLFFLGKALTGALDLKPGSMGYQLLKGAMPGAIGAPPTKGTQAHLQAYSTMPWVRAVASRVGHAVASTTWRLYAASKEPVTEGEKVRWRRFKHIQYAGSQAVRKSALTQLREEGTLKEIEEHPLLNLLHDGNQIHSGMAIRKMSAVHRDLVGESFWLKDRGALKQISEIWPLAPHWVLSTPTPTHQFYRVGFRGWQGWIPATEIVWFKDPDPAMPYWRGTGTAQALSDELETDEYACHDAQTECLTRRGWVLWAHVTPDDELATWSEERSCLEYQQPTALHVHAFNGTLHHWTGRSFDALVTPTHRFWMHGKVYQRPAHPGPFWHFETSTHARERLWAVPRAWRDAAKYDGLTTTVLIPSVARITKRKPGSRGSGRPPAHGVNDPRIYKARDFARFLGYVISEGSVGAAGISLCQKEGQFADDIRQALTIFPSAWLREKISDGPFGRYVKWSVLHLGLAEWVRSQVGCGAQNKRIPAEAFEWEQAAQHELFMGLMNGDGCWNKNGRSVGYATASRQLADDVQRLAVLLGYSSLLRGPRGRGYYYVNIKHCRDRRAIHGEGLCVKDVPYHGKVYCATVPNGLLITRRNGSVLVSGNSKYIKAFFYNHARPDVIITPKGENASLNPNEMERLEQQWTNEHQGFWRAFKPLFANRAVDVKVLEANFRQLQMKDLRQHVRDICLQVWGVSPEILGVLENSNRATIDAADYLFSKWVVVPRLEDWRLDYQRLLVPEYDERLILDYESPVQEDKAFAKEVMSALPEAFELDEIRDVVGKAPLADDLGKAHIERTTVKRVMDWEEPEEPLPNPLLQPGQPAPKPFPQAASIEALTDDQLVEMCVKMSRGEL